MQTSDVHVSAAPVKFAKIAVSSSGDNTVIPAVPGKKLRVLLYNFMSNGTVNAKFQSVKTVNGASVATDLTGLKYCVANVGISVPGCEWGIFETEEGALLNINLSAAIAIGGELNYQEVG